ncbi:MAG: IPT/TIG domain-containing protein [Planctomycetes bacterium]|nr:IPT/TIG domain-containing protein [Planctomycetota bacterium]
MGGTGQVTSTVIIAGTGFDTAAGATTVKFGAQTATITNITAVAITVTPPLPSNPPIPIISPNPVVVDVSVTTPGGTATKTGAFTWTAQ